MGWLRRRFIWTTAVFVLLALLAASYLLHEVNRLARRQAEAQLLETTRALSLVVDGELVRYETLLRALSSSGALTRRDFKGFDKVARAQLRGPDHWIVLGDRSGRQLVNTRLAPGADLPAGPPMPHMFAKLDRDETHVCDLSPGLVERRILCVDVPVMRDGRAVYHLSVIFHPRLLQRIIDDQKVPPSRYATVLDRNGIVVWRNVEPERFAGKPATPDMVAAVRARPEGLQESISLNGVPTVIAHSRGRHGLSFLVAIPRGEIGASGAWALRSGIGIAGSLLLIAVLIAFVAGKRLSDAITSLSGAAVRITGNHRASFRPTGIPEVDHVGAALEQATAERRAADERFDLAQEVGGIGSWDWDVAADAGHVSPSYRRLHGVPVHDAPLRLRDVFVRVHPEDREPYVDRLKAGMASGGPVANEYRVVHDDGSVHWVAVKGRAIHDASGTPVRAVGIVRDITAERRAQAALAANEELLQLLIDTLPVFISYIDRGLVYRLVNRTYESWFGRPRAELLGRHIREVLGDEAYALRTTQLEAVLRGEPQSFEAFTPKPDGTRRDTQVQYLPRRDEAGDVIGFFALVSDITEQKAMEEKLRQLTVALEATVEQRTAERDRLWELSYDPFLIAARDGTWLAASPAWERILGWTLDELIGRTAEWMQHPDDRAPIRRERAQVVGGGTTSSFQNRYRTKDGSYRWFGWTAVFDGERFYCVARDVTAEREQAEALRRTQEALVQSQKIEAMGKITGGVAHDINNLLTPILGGLDLLQRRDLPDVKARQLVGGALEAAERARVLVQRLLAFARRQPLQTGAVDVGALATGMRDLIASTLGPQMTVVVDAAPALPLARADQSQLEMALLNLSVNARDAMPEGGLLRISVRQAAVPEGNASLEPGRYVTLAVTDSGTGMSPEVLAKAIEPFFSTKGIGRGTGLGLSMVHGLMAQLGGDLVINSTPGLGTTVELWLPEAKLPAAAPIERGDAAELPVATGTALLVDDEALVRTSVAAMLAELGYAVIEADSAAKALALIDGGLSIDLLVTDHLMPGTTGTELARMVQGRLPQAATVIISGYADVEDIAPDLPRLTKPFRQDELAKLLSRLVGTSACQQV